jgi:hypothetical protein
MFGVNWGDSQTLLVNITNATLGIVVLILFMLVLYRVIHDLMVRH